MFLVPASAQAQTAQADVEVKDAARPEPTAETIGGAPPVAIDACVEVDIAGYKAGHLDCATLRLREAMRAAQTRVANAPSLAVPSADSADVVTGVANQTATRHRMGGTFGTAVRPQRPPAPIYTSVIGRRP